MKRLGLHEIRKEYLEFFKHKQHLVAKSFSLVPKNDKSLLLIGAGMAPLKPYFTGEATPPANRMATCQKCIRTGDIDNVGVTARHATFFEMLGNFSFGDYFKKEAISWAWEFCTQILELPADKLWVTIYLEDDEAHDLWKNMIGISEEKIVRLGKEDNFWELEIGPSGPCSEIYIDRGKEFGCDDPNCKPGCDCDRFLEFWNLVFTQFDKDENGIYHPLPNPNIDTGMGLERMAAIMEDVETIFDIAAIKEILDKVLELSDYNYKSDKVKDVSVRLITDHTRAMTFLVSDGVIPGNEGRGYVLRRLIRRAARHGKLLGIKGSFLSEVSEVVINSWGVEYDELLENKDRIMRIIKTEEEKFQETINQGLAILEDYVSEMKAKNELLFSGEKAFKLYDTYGFPLELSIEILKEKGISVDVDSFNENMKAQKERARKARAETDGGWGAKDEEHIFDGLESEFVGYDTEEIESQISLLLKDGEGVSLLTEGEEGYLLLAKTPFYAESGGQVGDKGTIEAKAGRAKVIDTTLVGDNLHLQKVIVEKGKLEANETVLAKIDSYLRSATRRNHSATHLLHKALRNVLGNHIHQAGSLVAPGRLRFDFTHFEAVSKENLTEIEKLVNEEILKGNPVITEVTTLREAQERGVTGIFEDKYGEYVRVLTMGDFSKELCGGTHVNNTGQIGMFKIISEAGIASGIRRIEALTGENLFKHLISLESELDELAGSLKTTRPNLLDKAKTMIEQSKEKEKEIQALKGKMSSQIADELVENAELIEDVKLIVAKIQNTNIDGMRNLGDALKDKLGSGVVVLGTEEDGKLIFIATATKGLVNRKVHSGNIVKKVAAVAGGGGGGRPDMAQAGGKDIEKLDEALATAKLVLKEQLSK